MKRKDEATVALLGAQAPQALEAAVESPQALEAAAESALHVRVLSVNVWCHYFAALGGLARFRARGPAQLMPQVPFGPRLDAIAELVASSGVDIVAVQELFLLRVGPFVLDAAWVRFAGRMRALGLCYYTEPRETLPCLFGQSSGLGVFSRWPLEAQSTTRFEQSREWANRKGLLNAVVRLPSNGGAANGAAAPGLTLSLVNCHVDKRPSAAKLAQFAQLGAAAHAVLDAQPAPKALVICGDFNATPFTPGAAPSVSEAAAPGSEWRALEAALGGPDARDARGTAEVDGSVRGVRARITCVRPLAPLQQPLLNGWGDLRAPRPLPPTHGTRTVDHVWLLTRQEPGGLAGVRFARACEALPAIVTGAAGDRMATDHMAVYAELQCGVL
jgi:hypothetical protein